jgi:hypothetical protein
MMFARRSPGSAGIDRYHGGFWHSPNGCNRLVRHSGRGRCGFLRPSASAFDLRASDPALYRINAAMSRRNNRSNSSSSVIVLEPFVLVDAAARASRGLAFNGHLDPRRLLPLLASSQCVSNFSTAPNTAKVTA